MQGNGGAARHRVGEEKPGKTAVQRRHDCRAERLPVGRGGVEGVGSQRGGVDSAAEEHLRAVGATHVGCAVGGGDAADGEGCQGIQCHAA